MKLFMIRLIEMNPYTDSYALQTYSICVTLRELASYKYLLALYLMNAKFCGFNILWILWVLIIHEESLNVTYMVFKYCN